MISASELLPPELRDDDTFKSVVDELVSKSSRAQKIVSEATELMARIEGARQELEELSASCESLYDVYTRLVETKAPDFVVKSLRDVMALDSMHEMIGKQRQAMDRVKEAMAVIKKPENDFANQAASAVVPEMMGLMTQGLAMGASGPVVNRQPPRFGADHPVHALGDDS